MLGRAVDEGVGQPGLFLGSGLRVGEQPCSVATAQGLLLPQAMAE